MKVYSATKLRRNSFQLNEAIKNNIHQLASLLKSSSTNSLSLSPSGQAPNAEEEAIILAKEFVSSLSDPYQCMILYPLVLDSQYSCPPDPIFQYTSYPEELHCLLTLYLHRCTGYSSLERRSRKIIDVFYRYINEEASQAYEGWLSRDNDKSLGEWFYTECISSFCQLIYKEQDVYTVFITNYLKNGLAYLFVCGASALRGSPLPPEGESIDLERIKCRFVAKYLSE